MVKYKQHQITLFSFSSSILSNLQMWTKVRRRKGMGREAEFGVRLSFWKNENNWKFCLFPYCSIFSIQIYFIWIFVTIEEEDKIVPFFWKSKPKAQYKLPITLYNFYYLFIFFAIWKKNIFLWKKISFRFTYSVCIILRKQKSFYVH